MITKDEHATWFSKHYLKNTSFRKAIGENSEKG